MSKLSYLYNEYISLYDFNFPLFFLDGNVFIGFPLSCELRLLTAAAASLIARGIDMSSFATLLSNTKKKHFVLIKGARAYLCILYSLLIVISH